MHETNGPLHCTQCGKSILGSSMFCAQCGKRIRLSVSPSSGYNTTHSSVITILAVAALFAFVAIAIGLSSKDTTNNSTSKLAEFCKNFPFDETCPNHDQHRASEIAHQPDQLHSRAYLTSACLEMGKRSSEVDEYDTATTITGTIENNCGKDFSYIEIDFKLFDHKGNVVGSAIANQANLKAGETWKYHAVGIPAYSNRFDSITAY